MNAQTKELPKACSDEAAAVEFLERQRWGSDPHCPRCESRRVHQLKQRGNGERSKRFLWYCEICQRQYTVRIGTVLEDSRIALRHWCYAFWAARGDVTTNRVEGFFSLIKRGLYGTFHAVSRKHLHRYLAEFTFRYNTRKATDGERVTMAIRSAVGKRLRYKEPA